MNAISTSRRQILKWTAASAIGLALNNSISRGEEPAENPIVKMFSGKLVTTDLGDGLFMITGGGGNVMASKSGDGVLVIDSAMPFRAKDYLAAVEGVAPGAKRKVLFNTHWHLDHTGGNAGFAEAGYTIVASENTRKRMGQKIVMEDMGMTNEPSPEIARPVVTFEKSIDLFEGSPAQIIKIAPAHTDTDAIVLFTKAGILHTGDLHFNGTFPVIDRSTGGSLDGMIAASKQLLEMIDAKTRVVPGHGPLADKATLAAQLELLSLTHDRLAPLGEKKMTIEEVVAKAPLADLDDKWGRGFLRSPIFTRMAYGQWVTGGK
jgi:glyoxylase-like metal-dependent hydrolase (beta-lactamase superfamily II)